ncbi:MAG: hypothetical protein H0W68_00580 [Gemmatimonadaceae bacterium]|nr:hypothetical protein [Gemmatimonadaceae bacterium]
MTACVERPAPSSGSDIQATTVRDTTAWTVSFTALGPLRVGSSPSAAAAALRIPLPAVRASDTECAYVRPESGPLDGAVELMVVKDVIVRIDVDSSSVATTWGDRVGDTESEVLARHAGRIRVEPHKYTGPTGHYLVVDPPTDTLHQLIFETDGKQVTSYRIGLRPFVEWVEGCS